jgi:1-acyl-sn-glycerol-3-phosphate acyltransferase
LPVFYKPNNFATLIKILQYIYCIYAYVVFILVMLLLLPFFAIASLFGKVNGGNAMYTICRIWSDIILFCWGVYHVNINAPSYNHSVVYVFNHISYIDIPLLLKAIRKKPIRILGKAELGKVPIFGFIYRNASVTVDRSSETARAKSVTILKSVLAKNINIVIAPEGTFNTSGQPLKEMYNGAFKIAADMQIPIQPIIFLDAYDRLNYKSVFSLTPGKSRAMFLPLIAANNNADELKAQTKQAMENCIIENKATWLKN